MRGELLVNVLERISEGARSAGDFFAAFLTAGYGASVRGLEYQTSLIRRERERRSFERTQERQLRQRYHSFVYQLKRDGLIIEQGTGGEKRVRLTARGKTRLANLRERLTHALPARGYRAEASTQFTIVTFDIPERQRRKRDWLREVLVGLGFRSLQKSVLIGKVRLPAEFITDLKHLHMIDFVEIFAITKTGSIRHVA